MRKRLVADVPLGALLSGGIDSAIVVALMAQAGGRAGAHVHGRLRATAATTSAPTRERSPSAYGTLHEEIVLEPDAAATLPRLAAAFDEPLGDEAALPQLLVCEAARREVTVALAGDGGDESFAGYERYVAYRLAGRVPRPLASLGAATLGALPAAQASTN